MARSDYPPWQRAIVVLTQAVLAVIVVGALYWAEPILLPIALAIFFSLILTPLVSSLQRTGLGRTPAVLTVVLTVGILLISLGWLFSKQVTSLIAELPQHRHKISAKLRSLQEMMEGGVSERIRTMVEEIKEDLKEDIKSGNVGNPTPPTTTPTTAAPVAPVATTPPFWDWQARLTQSADSILASLASGFLALVLVIFILVRREDLRDRVMRLVGRAHVTTTTKAVEEAFQRVSRFLLMQACLNAIFGLVVAVLFWWMGLKYALLWGVLAAVMKYLPYIGVWIAAFFPVALSVALSDTWTQPILILTTFLALELVVANVIEPLLFGHSAGVAPVALLVSAAFWAFLWGPVGMVLSIPMTVVLVVLGRYVPQLEFFTILLSDEPALPPRISFYQRLLAREGAAALDLTQTYQKEMSPVALQDDLLIGALVLLKKDRLQEQISKEDEQSVLGVLEEVLAKIPAPQKLEATLSENSSQDRPVRLLVCPARDDADYWAARLLPGHLRAELWSVEVVDSGNLAGELIARLQQEPRDVVCLTSLPPGGLVAARYLVKRLRRAFPDLKIIVGRWGLRNALERNIVQLQDAGADAVTLSLEETRDQLTTWRPILTSETPRPALSRKKKLAAR